MNDKANLPGGTRCVIMAAAAAMILAHPAHAWAANDCDNWDAEAYVPPREQQVLIRREQLRGAEPAALRHILETELLRWASDCAAAAPRPDEARYWACDKRVIATDWVTLAAAWDLLASEPGDEGRYTLERAVEVGNSWLGATPHHVGLWRRMADWWRRTYLDGRPAAEVIPKYCEPQGHGVNQVRGLACGRYVREQVAGPWDPELYALVSRTRSNEMRFIYASCRNPNAERYKRVLERVDVEPDIAMRTLARACAEHPLCDQRGRDDGLAEAVRWFLAKTRPSEEAMEKIRKGLENRGCVLKATSPPVVTCGGADDAGRLNPSQPGSTP